MGMYAVSTLPAIRGLRPRFTTPWKLYGRSARSRARKGRPTLNGKTRYRSNGRCCSRGNRTSPAPAFDAECGRSWSHWCQTSVLRPRLHFSEYHSMKKVIDGVDHMTKRQHLELIDGVLASAIRLGCQKSLDPGHGIALAVPSGTVQCRAGPAYLPHSHLPGLSWR